MNSNVNWIVDTYILESRGFTGDLEKSIVDSGCNLYSTRYIPFADEQDYGPEGLEKSPTILYGTHGFVRKCKIPFIPGAYGLTNNMNCNVYYSNIPGEWMLNSDFIMLPFSLIQSNPKKVFDIIGSNKIFVRPNSGFKTFAGQVWTDENIEFELNSSQQLTSVVGETICLVSPVKKLKGEFRFIIGNGEVIDGSEYRWENVLDIRHDFDYDCLLMAKKMAEHSWQPDTVYSCDVALTDNGPKIIEINSFACCGLYACDKNLVVNRVSEIARDEFVG